MRRLPITLAVLLLVPSAAQAMDGALDMGMIGMDAALSHVQQHEERRAKRMAAQRPSQAIASRLALQARRGAVAGASAPAAAASASYRASTAVRERIAGIMSDAAEQRKPGTAQEMRELVTSGKALQQYGMVAPRLGYRTNDAIDALAFYLLAQWGVANDHRPDITRTQAAGVRRQAANAYDAVAGQIGSDALRQEFAEVLIVQGIIMAGVHEAAVRGNDRAALAQYASMARQGGRQLFTMDPTRIALTDDGFREK